MKNKGNKSKNKHKCSKNNRDKNRENNESIDNLIRVDLNKQKYYFMFLTLFQQNCRYCLFSSTSYGICSNCLKYFTYFLKPFYTYINQVKIISLSRYISKVRKEILNFKLRDNREISKFFILSIFNYPNLISDLSKYEYITYVPMDKYKERYYRGYNQSKVLAKDLSMFLGIPVIDLIEKVKKNKTQSTTSREERYLNVKDVYRVNTNINLDLKLNSKFNLNSQPNSKLKLKKNSNSNSSTKNILLVDDIYTTGATVFEIIKKIKEKYNKTNMNVYVNVDVLVLSKTISINKNTSSLVSRKNRYYKLLENRKLKRKRMLIELYN